MSTKTETRKTSAEIKKQIEEATKTEKSKTELKDSGLPLTGQVANEINATESTPEATKTAESKPEPVNPTAEGATAESVDLKEWAKKRGIDWTTEESVLSALRKSDQEFHKRQQERKSKEQVQTQFAPPPTYQQPSYSNGYYPPAYVPPPTPVVENIARQYNMTVEDVQRLSAFNRDFFEVLIKQELERRDRRMEEISVENTKNTVFRELASDPVFRRPDVGEEFHRVIDQMQGSDPTSFEKDPNQYRRAFETAVYNIGRRNLEGRILVEGVPPNPSYMTPPTSPPKPLGQGSGGGYQDNENSIDPKEFAKMSLEDKRKTMERMGLRTTY